ncbi:hypothetical protein [Kitasatospora terrestris]|uniref:Uncharacterized protein n=1 Tax=Kitasatospora terrestris TaxID=258051 RepID=A0ABP9E9K0_9ACTN
MTGRRTVSRAFGAAVAVPLALLAVGWWHSRPGGRVLVAQTLDRPLVLLPVALLLAAVACCFVEDRGNRAVGLFLTWVAGAVLVLGAWGASAFAEPTTVTREAAPGGADRTLVVVHHGSPGAEAEAQSWEIQVESGSGWSARRWTVLELPGRSPGGGLSATARWTGPERFTVTTDRGVRLLFGVDPRSGRPTPTGSAP